MTEQKKEIRKNPHPLIVKGIFFVTAVFEDKRYVVSNGLSFLNFAKEGDGISKGDYVEIHGPVYQGKNQSNAIVTGEAIVRKLSEEEVDKYKADMSKLFDGAKKETKKAAPKKATKKAEENKMPWE